MIPPKAIKKVKNEIHLEIAAGSLIAYGIFPQTSEGIQKAKETAASKDTWLAPSDLSEYYDGIDNDLITGKETDGIRAIRRHLEEFYGISSAEIIDDIDTNVVTPEVYDPGDKFVDDGKEFADKIVDDLDVALEEKSDEIMDAIDAIIAEDKRKIEEFKAKVTRKVNHPELFSELQHIKPRYMWGQNGLYDLEFKSDIDRAIYFAGKLGSNKKESEDKVAVREWLLLVTGLNVYDDYNEIKKYRAEILSLILQLVKLNPNEGEVIVPPVYDGYYQDPDEDEEEPEDLDDLLGEIKDEADAENEDNTDLDDLLDLIHEESITDAEEAEGEQKIEEALEVTQDITDGEIDPDILSDLPPGLQESLVNIINKKRKDRTKLPQQKDPNQSSSITNAKIYRYLSNNLVRIHGELNSIHESIKEQNALLRSNIDLTLATLESVEGQDRVLESRLDTILRAFNIQNEAARKFEEDLKRQQIEDRLEQQKDTAFTEGFANLTGETSSSGFLNKIIKFFGKKLGKFLWKLLPKKFRAGSRFARMGAKRATGKMLGKVATKIAAKKLASEATEKVTQRYIAKGVVKGFEHIALPAIKSSDSIAAKGVQKGGGNLLTRALKSPAIQKALITKLGKEGAEKLTVKLAAKLIPGVSTVYGLGEGLARILMGDVKGGFLSFGSALPVAGYGFAAVDILRDIDTEAYTKHIEGPAMSGKLGDEQFAAFFADALGVTENQYEVGTRDAKPGVAMLHGTELILPKENQENINPMSLVGGSILSATSNYINSIGPLGASIAPTFEQVAAPLAKEYGMPATLTQTKVGGSLPSFVDVFKKAKEKTDETDTANIDSDLEELKTPKSFADKLMDMLKNPFEKFMNAVKNKTGSTDSPTVDGDSLMAEGGYAVQTGEITSGFRTASRSGHNGIDIAGGNFREGTPISVIKPGKVVFAGWQDPNNHKAGWGQFVAIEHDDGTASLYGHLSSINVSQGQRIEPSADGKFPVIGKLGNTGRSTGPHLHFEVGTGWTGGTLKGHMNPASMVNQYLRGGGNVKAVQSPDAAPVGAPKGDFDVIIPLDHVKPGNQNKIPDTRGGNTFKNASATGAAGRERDHQDSAAAKIRSKLEAKGLRVKVITPEDFGNYEDYDNYIKTQSSKGTRVVPLHFDAAVGQGGTGFLTRTRAGDTQDAALAAPIQAQIAKFQRANPSLGNLGSTDTVSNATINRAAAAPAALVEMGSMVAWEKAHGKNFTSTSTFDKLATGIAEGIYKGGGFNNKLQPPSNQKARFESLQGTDSDESTKYLIVNQQSQPSAIVGRNSAVQFVPMGAGRWKTKDEYSDAMRKVIMSRLAR